MKPAISKTHPFAVERWGLQIDKIHMLPDKLQDTWARFRNCFKTKTRDSSLHANTYLKGLILLKTERNYTNISKQIMDIQDDGQAIQHFITDSPWSAKSVFYTIQEELARESDLAGGMLSLDESGDEKTSTYSAGVKRQYFGRAGKVEMGQVGVALNYSKTHAFWTMVDAELFLPESEFSPSSAEKRKRTKIPPERVFQTKIELGFDMIQQARKNGLPFSIVSFDTLYGRNIQFRAKLHQDRYLYMGSIPCSQKVYLQKPIVGVPSSSRKKGKKPTKKRVLFPDSATEVREWAKQPEVEWTQIEIGPSERGVLTYESTARRVWSVTKEGDVFEEWLYVRKEQNEKLSYALCNASSETSLFQLASWRCQHHFIERTFQDAKSDIGWDELRGTKYSSWMHHTALTALALWFIHQTKWEWERELPRDPVLVQELEAEWLPLLSVANVKLLLQATLPLEQLSVEQSAQLVVEYLVKRTQATKSRRKKQKGKNK